MTTSTQRGVTTFPIREVKGLDLSVLGTLAPNGKLFPMKEAFEHEWPSYSHFTCYVLDGVSLGEPTHRLNKELESLPEYASRIKLDKICLDFDLPKGANGEKVTWASAGGAQATENWLQWVKSLPYPYFNWAHWCTTASGWHLTYLLSQPLQPSMFEAVARGIRRDFRTALGVEVDEKCSDWTRLYAMPKVVKPDGSTPFREPWFRTHWQPLELDPKDITPEMSSKGFMASRAVEAMRPKECPDPAAAMALVYQSGDIWTMTALGVRMRRKLEEALPSANEHAESVRALLDPKGYFKPGSRDQAVSQTTGWVVSRLVTVEECSAEAVFGLFVPVCEKTDTMYPREEGGSWLDKAWTKIQEWWRKDSARHAETIAIQKATLLALKHEVGGLEGICTRLSQYLKHEGLVSKDRQKSTLLRFAILLHGSGDYYSLQEDGTYKGPFSNLNAAMGGVSKAVALESGLSWCIEKDGAMQQKWLPGPDVQRMSCARVTDVLSVFGSTPGRSRVIELLDGDTVRLSTVGASINPHIVPRWSDRVDRLLRKQTGCSTEDNSRITQAYREMYYWLAHVTLVDRWKLPALFLYGAPRTGKSLWCRAVSMLFTGSPSGGYVLTQRWNLSLSYSAIVAMDEGLPNLRGVAGKQATQVLRRIIVGDPVPVEGKGMQIRTAQMNWRVIASENSADSFYALMDSFGNFAARDEKVALGQRIHLVKVDQSAAEWINQNQDDLFGDPNRDFVLEMAQHAAYLVSTIEQHREGYFTDIHACRQGNLIQFPSTVTKQDAIDAVSPTEHRAMVSLMEEIVKLANPSSAVTPIETQDFVVDSKGNVMSTRMAIGTAAGKRESVSTGRPMFSEKHFIDLMTSPAEGDLNNDDRRRIRKQPYSLITGEPVGLPITRRWRKIELDLLLRYVEDRDVPGLDRFTQLLSQFKAARGLN